MHEEDERPPNEKSHAYHFSIAYNGCEFCLLTPPAILALPKCIFKGCMASVNSWFHLLKILFSSLQLGNCSVLHKDEHKKMQNIRNC